MSVSINRTVQRFTSGPQDHPNIVLIHTTEGMGWPGYGGGSSAPHATVKPIPGKGIEVREHIPFGQFAKALVNASGGVQTNTSGVLQFELMGTCDERSKGSMYYWPDADDAVMEALADYLRPIMATYNIPHSCNVTFKSYNKGQAPSSYGRSNGVRMSYDKWNSYKGICGHQHAPENDHGDPGDFDVDRLIKFLGGAGSSTSKPAIVASKPTVKFYKPKGVKLSVKEIQKAAGVPQDGLYGADTKAAVKRLQGTLKVAADGLWGPDTEAAYLKTKSASAAPTSKGSFALIAEDGIWGPKTIKRLQQQVGVSVDGIAGPQTWKAIQGWVGTAQDGIRGPKTVKALQRKVGVTVNGSWNHWTIRALQRHLNNNRKK